MAETTDNTDLSIAVIGMAGRFPGADSVPRFWENLCNGIESIDRFSQEQLQEFGVSAIDIERPEFVPFAPILEDADCFDAQFFGYSPREAELMDPQQRVFLECAWHALEAAGYPPGNCPALTGVYAGTSLSSYLLYNVLPSLTGPHAEETLQAMIANDKDFLSTRVSYKLNLCGPSVDVQTGCSTSLVAIHFAAQSLLSYQCDLALAGGVSIQVPQRRGYIYQKGALYSPDGHCRAFDSAAEGTLFGSGVGVVVLKRLEQALVEGDHIHAVLKGTAINNDGNAKVGYTAPSVRGQSEVIRLAHAYAGVSADTIGYVECHGTGTPLGDPAELTALTKAFRVSTQKRNFCGIGSVKSNIGHLDAAAGVASFIKTVLAVEHGLIPPSLHFVKPHPDLALADSPFYVNHTLSDWPMTTAPRRAGVSSFGIGGTNAHAVLEQAPVLASLPSNRTAHVLTLSAKSKRSLEKLIQATASNLEQEPQKQFADTAFTTQVSRSQLPFRCAIVGFDREEAVNAIRNHEQGRVYIGRASQDPHRIVFMFPGGGAQYVNMTADLYREDRRFRTRLDELLEIASAELGFGLKQHIFPEVDDSTASIGMRDPLIGLTALFLVEYALAEYWIQWGITPDACIGHSLGEYVAACVAGILTVKEALRLLIARSRLLKQLPAGAMLSIPLSFEEVSPLLGDDLSIAAVNGPSQTVVSGGADAIRELSKRLLAEDIESRQIQIAVSSHSHMVEPVMPEFGAIARTIKPRVPQIPYISNVTGTWLSDEEAIPAEYWVSHLREPVLFGKGIGALLDDPHTILLEVGPGTTLTTLVQTQFGSALAPRAIASMRHPYDRISDCKAILCAAAQLWTSGVSLDWTWLYAGESRRKVPLPTYPFERRQFWLRPDESLREYSAMKGKFSHSRWLHQRRWIGGSMEGQTRPSLSHESALTIAGNGSPLSRAVQSYLESSGISVSRFGARDIRTTEHSQPIEAKQKRDDSTGDICENAASSPALGLYFATVDTLSDSQGQNDSSLSRLEDLLATIRSLGQSGTDERFDLLVVTNGLCKIYDDDAIVPANSWIESVCIVAEQEYPNLRIRRLDIELDAQRLEAQALQICNELVNLDGPKLSAIRGQRKWRATYELLRTPTGDASGLRRNGVYLITGGLGNLGLQLAAFLARSHKANIALLSRTTLPERSSWERILASEPADSTKANRIHGVELIESLGSQVLLIEGDVSDRESMAHAIEAIQKRFGALNGIFHLAGTTGREAVQLISDATLADIGEQTEAKATGAQVIEEVSQPLNLDFVLLFSSSAAYLGGVGLMAYTGANLFLDAVAQRNENASATRWISVNWDAWVPTDIAQAEPLPKELLEHAISYDQGCQIVSDIIAAGVAGPIVVSAVAPELRIDRTRRQSAASRSSRRPLDDDFSWDSDRPYSPPTNDVEREVTQIFEEVLGRTKISIHDNFFEIGGTSLIALRLISRIKREMQIEVPIISVFDRPTIATFAGMLSSMRPETSAAMTAE